MKRGYDFASHRRPLAWRRLEDAPASAFTPGGYVPWAAVGFRVGREPSRDVRCPRCVTPRSVGLCWRGLDGKPGNPQDLISTEGRSVGCACGGPGSRSVTRPELARLDHPLVWVGNRPRRANRVSGFSGRNIDNRLLRLYCYISRACRYLRSALLGAPLVAGRLFSGSALPTGPFFLPLETYPSSKHTVHITRENILA